MTNETLEAVARAIYEAETHSIEYDLLTNFSQEYFLVKARAAIAAYEQSQEYRGMVANARRYCWIREASRTEGEMFIHADIDGHWLCAGDELDEGIDTAIAQGDGHGRT